jgi:hypothetical protein
VKVPFPDPVGASPSVIPKLPPFVLYTPLAAALEKPAEGEKESIIRKVKRTWQEKEREARKNREEVERANRGTEAGGLMRKDEDEEGIHRADDVQSLRRGSGMSINSDEMSKGSLEGVRSPDSLNEEEMDRTEDYSSPPHRSPSISSSSYKNEDYEDYNATAGSTQVKKLAFKDRAVGVSSISPDPCRSKSSIPVHN